jgi:hypothetical protein
MEQGSIDTPLEDAILDEAAYRVVSERCGNGGAESEATAQAASHVVLSSALPNLQ